MQTLKYLLLILLLMPELAFGQEGHVTLSHEEAELDTAWTPNAIIKLSKEKFDFGIVTQGQAMWDTVFITNIGNRILHIKYVQTNDGGAASGKWTPELKPNETGFIVGGFPNTNSWKGKKVSQLQIHSNARNGQPVLIFPMYIEVIPKEEK